MGILWHTDLVQSKKLSTVDITKMVRKLGFGKNLLRKQNKLGIFGNNRTGIDYHYKYSGIIVYTLA